MDWERKLDEHWEKITGVERIPGNIHFFMDYPGVDPQDKWEAGDYEKYVEDRKKELNNALFKEKERPQVIDIAFDNLDNIILNLKSASLKTKKLNADEMYGKLENTLLNQEQTNKVLQKYMVGTMDPFMETAYRELDEKQTGVMREHLILVNGLSVQEHLKRAGHLPDAVNREEYNRKVSNFVGIALQNGAKVEAYVPDKDGKIPARRIELHAAGCKVSEMKLLPERGWEKFCNFFGVRTERQKRNMEVAQYYQNLSQSKRDLRNMLGDRLTGLEEAEKKDHEMEGIQHSNLQENNMETIEDMMEDKETVWNIKGSKTETGREKFFALLNSRKREEYIKLNNGIQDKKQTFGDDYYEHLTDAERELEERISTYIGTKLNDNGIVEDAAKPLVLFVEPASFEQINSYTIQNFLADGQAALKDERLKDSLDKVKMWSKQMKEVGYSLQEGLMFGDKTYGEQLEEWDIDTAEMSEEDLLLTAAMTMDVLDRSHQLDGKLSRATTAILPKDITAEEINVETREYHGTEGGNHPRISKQEKQQYAEMKERTKEAVKENIYRLQHEMQRRHFMKDEEGYQANEKYVAALKEERNKWNELFFGSKEEPLEITVDGKSVSGFGYCMAVLWNENREVAKEIISKTPEEISKDDFLVEQMRELGDRFKADREYQQSKVAECEQTKDKAVESMSFGELLKFNQKIEHAITPKDEEAFYVVPEEKKTVSWSDARRYAPLLRVKREMCEILGDNAGGFDVQSRGDRTCAAMLNQVMSYKGRYEALAVRDYELPDTYKEKQIKAWDEVMENRDMIQEEKAVEKKEPEKKEPKKKESEKKESEKKEPEKKESELEEPELEEPELGGSLTK